jgi:hypothetical protein
MAPCRMARQVGTNRRKVLPPPKVINSVQMGEMRLSKSTYLSTKPHSINPDDSNFLSRRPEKDISHIHIEKLIKKLSIRERMPQKMYTGSRRISVQVVEAVLKFNLPLSSVAYS